MRRKLLRYKYKIIEYRYNKDGIRLCYKIHLFDSKVKYFFLILYFKIKHIEYEILENKK